VFSRLRRNGFEKILIYLAVGGSAFLLYFFILWILFDLIGVHYPFAVTLSYLISSVFHFLSHRAFTFQIKSDKYRRQFIYYFFVAALNYFIQLGTIKVLYEYIKFNIYISAFLGILLSLVVGYTLLNNWVFKEAK